MPEYTYDESIFSDLHKDAFGFRPCEHEFYEAEPVRKQEIWNALIRAHNDEMERYRLLEEEGKREFEQAVYNAIASGAKSRFTAIRWLMDGLPEFIQNETWNQKLNWLEYEFNLPYAHLNEHRSDDPEVY